MKLTWTAFWCRCVWVDRTLTLICPSYLEVPKWKMPGKGHTALLHVPAAEIWTVGDGQGKPKAGALHAGSTLYTDYWSDYFSFIWENVVHDNRILLAYQYKSTNRRVGDANARARDYALGLLNSCAPLEKKSVYLCAHAIFFWWLWSEIQILDKKVRWLWRLSRAVCENACIHIYADVSHPSEEQTW